MNVDWEEFCGWFHQDCNILGEGWEEIISFIISHRSREDALKIRDFLDALFARNLSDQELKDIWLAPPADVSFKNKESYRIFYTMIRDTADRHVQGQLPKSPLPDV